MGGISKMMLLQW